MADIPAGAFQEATSKLITPDPNREVTDTQLLERFIKYRDEAAFAKLVARHGGTVWGVCRRILQQDQDTEDAFQAVFLILARKSASIRKGEAVGSWLYGVAYRTAMKARHSAARRQQREKKAVGPIPEQPPWGEAACRELQRLLDGEVQRLAEKYRAPFVLCCLEGKSKSEAAKELGWLEGTVSGRLARARKLLQSRLARRGVTLTAVLTAVALTQNTVAAAAPPVLIHATIEAILASLGGRVTANPLSPSVITLADNVSHARVAAKLVPALLLLLGLLALMGGALLAVYHQGWYADDNSGAENRIVHEPETFVPPPVGLGTATDDQVFAVAFSPDSRRLVTAGAGSSLPGQLKIWDVKSSRELLALNRIAGVRSVAFSPDGETLATGDGSGAVKLRAVATGVERLKVHAHSGGVYGVAYAPNGLALASTGWDRTVKLWSADLEELQTMNGHADAVKAVAFFAKRQALVTGARDKLAIIWDLRTGQEKLRLQGHAGSVDAVAIAPNDNLVATAGEDQTVRLWNVETGEELAVLQGNQGPVRAVAFSPGDGKFLASAGLDGTVCLWDVESRELVGSLAKHAGAVWTLAFSRDGSYLASGSADKTAKVWPMKGGGEAREKTLATTWSGTKPILAAAYSPGGNVLAVATKDKGLHIRAAKSGDVILVLAGHEDDVTCLAFTPDGLTLATGSLDTTVKLWDLTTGREIQALRGHTKSVRALAFTPDGKKLASASDDNIVRLWDPGTGKTLMVFEGHQAVVRALAFAPDGKRLASGSADRTIKLWDLEGDAVPVTLNGHEGAVRALAYSPTGILASAAEDTTVMLWETGKEPLSLLGHTGEVWALAFTPKGRTLVSAGQDTTVRIWDPEGGLKDVLNGHKDAVTCLAIHPLGENLVSGSLDTMLLRWQAKRRR
jgi:RNA polymerase sigma factor (sigma-70 family)